MLTVFNNLSIKYKLFIYFMVLVLLTILTIGFLTNIVFSNAMEKLANESALHAISQANISVETSIRNMENIMDIIARNPHVLKFIRMKIVDPSDERYEVESNVRSLLAGFTQYYYDIESIAIVNKNDLFISNEMYKVENDPLIDEGWYIKCIDHPDVLHILGRPFGRNLTEYKKVSTDEIFSIAKAVRDPSNNEVSGVILIDLRIKILENIIKDIQLGKSGFVYIADSNGDVVYAPVNHVVPRIKRQWFSDERVFNKYILGQHYQFIYTSSFYTKWKVIGVFSLNETLKEVVNIRNYTLVILLVISVIALGLSFILSSSIAKPISKLRRLMKKAESGDLSVSFDVMYNDEIGHLGRSFNAMINEIRNLIEVVYKEQKSKREAELRILQSQIKPHFLYNTLDTIHWMAKKYGATDVIQVINALTKLFRISLSKGNEVITLSEELEHVKSYLLIQKVRYEEMLEYEIIVQNDLNKLYIQKIILQPIVENAIYHGIKAKGEPGKIVVTASVEDNTLVLRVKDDGVGIKDNELEAINNTLENLSGKRTGYGLFNVNERIRLSYGNEYGITLKSAPGKGTEVIIRHPVMKTPKG
ncbi:MAG TPA: sensor histidine kinase [Clostridiaceae bacterium]|nr:sensor histidine kinase [Clostridiaceae bacterium]